MSELLIVSLLSTVLSGVAGSTSYATVLLYSPIDQTVTVQNQAIALQAGKPSEVQVPITIRKGRYQETVHVITNTLQYDLTTTVIGKRNLTWLWWFAALPLIGVFAAIRIRRRPAGSS